VESFRRLVDRLLGRQQPEEPERTPEQDAQELRWDAIKKHEERVERGDDKERYDRNV